MNVLLESPLFPTPVRWFEIPMKSAPSGLAHLTVEASAETGDLAAEVLESAQADTARLLDEHV